MIYEIYETDAFVIGARNRAEGDRRLSLYTRSFGLVEGVAKNVRASTSKLRGSLEPLSRSSVSLVRGREQWRIVGASRAEHLFLSLPPARLTALSRVFDLLSRLVRGEGESDEVFASLESFISGLSDDSLGEHDARLLEVLTVARMLRALGYFADDARYAPFLASEGIPSPLSALAPLEHDLVSLINAGLRESQL